MSKYVYFQLANVARVGSKCKVYYVLVWMELKWRRKTDTAITFVSVSII
jgi:hypothetical protein